MQSNEIREQAEKAIINPIVLKDLLFDLAGSSRRNRQYAASTLSVTAKLNPETLVPHIGRLVDALECTEAQTRWETLDALSFIVPVAPEACREAIPGAEAALFDENNGLLHLSALRFFCALASISQEYSAELWPLIDEGIQCYHGDAEFSEMLTCVTSFSLSDLADNVKVELAARMAFDAANARGSLRRRAQQIIDNVKVEEVAAKEEGEEGAESETAENAEADGDAAAGDAAVDAAENVEAEGGDAE